MVRCGGKMMAIWAWLKVIDDEGEDSEVGDLEKTMEEEGYPLDFLVFVLLFFYFFLFCV